MQPDVFYNAFIYEKRIIKYAYIGKPDFYGHRKSVEVSSIKFETTELFFVEIAKLIKEGYKMFAEGGSRILLCEAYT